MINPNITSALNGGIRLAIIWFGALMGYWLFASLFGWAIPPNTYGGDIILALAAWCSIEPVKQVSSAVTVSAPKLAK